MADYDALNKTSQRDYEAQQETSYDPGRGDSFYDSNQSFSEPCNGRCIPCTGRCGR